MNKLNVYIAAVVLGVVVVFGFYAISRFEKVVTDVAKVIASAKFELAGATTYVEGGGLTASSVTSAHIVDGTVATSDLATGAVTTVKLTDANVTSAKLEESLVRYATVTIASDSFAELATTSIELVAAPTTSGKVNQLVSATFARVFASESWNTMNNSTTIGYNNPGKFAITASLSGLAGLFGGGVANTAASPSYYTLTPPTGYIVASNSAIVLRRSGATEPTIDGDTYFKVNVFYRVITLP